MSIASGSRCLAAALAAASARLWPAGASLLPCAWPVVAAQLHTSSQAAVVSHRRPPPTPSGAPKHAEGRLMNADITSRTVRLVGEDGHELLTRAEALARARAAGLDLVLVDATATPPVCRLLDADELRAAERAREKAARRKAVERRQLDVTKEFRLSLRTAENDVRVKAAAAAHALGEGHKAKLAVVFRSPREAGEAGSKEAALRLLAQARAAVMEACGGEQAAREDAPPKVDGLSVWLRLGPAKTKT